MNKFFTARSARLGAVACLIAIAVGSSILVRDATSEKEAASVSNPAQTNYAPKDALRSNVTSTAVADDPRAARLRGPGWQQISVPNVRGEYTRVQTSPNAIVSVQVPVPTAGPGDAVAIQAEDGGAFTSGVSDGKGLVDGTGNVNFDFRTGQYAGMHRVTIRHGSDMTTLEFWVGPQQPVLVRR